MGILKAGATFRAGVNREYEKVFPLGHGLVATDGVQYGPVATIGTTAVDVLNELIDPGYTIKTQSILVGLTQKFTGLNGSFVGSISYSWTMQPLYIRPGGTNGVEAITGTTITISPTLTKGVGTLTTSEDTLSGYVPVGSIPFAPFRVKLTATGLRAAVVTGKIKSSSYIKLVGSVIPGT